MDTGAVTQEEVWQIADLLSADRHVGDGLVTEESLAEAFGVPLDTIKQKINQIRGSQKDLTELEQLRAENDRLKSELRESRDAQGEQDQAPFHYSSTESTTYNDGFIETVRSERIRQAAWIPLTSFLLFLFIAAIMFSEFNRQTERMRSDVPFGKFPENVGPRPLDDRDAMKRIFEQRQSAQFQTTDSDLNAR